MRLRLVVPADVDAPTGGNVYDLAVTDELRGCGDIVELVRAEPSELAAVLSRPCNGATLVDGLLACPQPEAVASSRVAVLVHMALGLETGLPVDRAAELDRLERRALHAAVCVIATSAWSASYLARHHDLPHVAVAVPGVDMAPVGRGSDPPLIVQLAAVLPHKDQRGVVAALSAVRDLPWQARLAGSLDRDPAYAASVRDAVTATGLTERIRLPGVMARDEAWAGADLALLPSRTESYGMTVTEALARGVPAIVGAGGAAEALGHAADGRRPGALVPAGDADALTRQLRRWLSDPAYRSDLRDAALSRRAGLTGWDRTALSLRQAMSNAGPASP